MKITLRRAMPATLLLIGITATLLTTGTGANAAPITFRSFIALPGGGYATDVEIDPDTDLAYIADLSTITVVDTFTDSVVGSPITIPSGSGDLALNSVTKTLAISSTTTPVITLMDLNTHALTTIAVPGKIERLAFNTVTNELWFSQPAEDSISVFEMDTPRPTLKTTIEVGDRPTSLTVDRKTNRVYVGNQKSSTISLINGATKTVEKTIRTYAPANDLEVNIDTQKVYVASDIGLSMFDGISGSYLVRDLPSPDGNKPFFDLAVDPSTKKTFVINQGAGTLWTFDEAAKKFNPTGLADRFFHDNFPSAIRPLVVNPETGELLKPYYNVESGFYLGIFEQKPKATKEPRIVSGAPPAGEVRVPYWFQINAIASPALFTYDDGGTLPPGLSLDPGTGIISGTPTLAGIFSLSITAKNIAGAKAYATYLMTVTDPSMMPKIVPSSPPNGKVFQPYSFQIMATGPALKYEITSGKLPLGLILNSSTGEIYGTPAPAVGPFATRFTVSVSNAYGVATADYSIAIQTTP